VMGTGDNIPMMDNILDKSFGCRSRLYHALVDEIPIFNRKHKFFLRCMGTFFISCAMDLTLRQLCELNVFTGLLATEDEYNDFWRTIHLNDKPETTTSKSFWQIVEEAVNKVVRELFVTGVEGEIHMTIDDDKVHYHITRMMEPHEPKAIQHVRDNCHGLVIDTAVMNASHFKID